MTKIINYEWLRPIYCLYYCRNRHIEPQTDPSVFRQNKSAFLASENLQSHYKATETADLAASPNSATACISPGKGGGIARPGPPDGSASPGAGAQQRNPAADGETGPLCAQTPPCQPGADRNRAGRGSGVTLRDEARCACNRYGRANGGIQGNQEIMLLSNQ